MSDPMTTHEIEDVLSSIRRLVSDDLRPASRVGSPGSIPDARQKPTEKLLLTPALRVVGTDEGASETDEIASDKAEAFEAETSDIETIDIETSEPETDDTALFVPPPQAKPEFGAGDVVTRLGSGVADDDWESPLGDEGDWPEAGWGKPEAFTSESGDALRFIHRARDSANAPDVAVSDPVDSTLDIIDAPEVAFSAPDDLLADAGFIYVDRADGDAFQTVSDAGDSSNWADQAEAEAIADLSQKVEDEALATAAPDGEAMLFDEDVLRDLVRDLIREELAGSLGERITRNVRKLVRAEVARALTVQEAE